MAGCIEGWVGSVVMARRLLCGDMAVPPSRMTRGAAPDLPKAGALALIAPPSRGESRRALLGHGSWGTPGACSNSPTPPSCSPGRAARHRTCATSSPPSGPISSTPRPSSSGRIRSSACRSHALRPARDLLRVARRLGAPARPRRADRDGRPLARRALRAGRRRRALRPRRPAPRRPARRPHGHVGRGRGRRHDARAHGRASPAQCEALADRHHVSVANDNAPGQVVLSGAPDALDAAREDAEAQGLRARPLGVSRRVSLPADAGRRRAAARRPSRASTSTRRASPSSAAPPPRRSRTPPASSPTRSSPPCAGATR